jgi:hypothetical protein
MIRNRYVLISSALIALFGCSIDERDVVLGAGLPGQVGAAVPDAGGGSARLEVFPTTIDFGRVATGFQARGRITLSNAGDAPLAVPVVTWATPDADFGLLQNQCLAPLKPGERCELRVSLLPSRASALSAALRIDAHEGGSLDVSMAGEGLAAGNLILAPTPGYSKIWGAYCSAPAGRACLPSPTRARPPAARWRCTSAAQSSCSRHPAACPGSVSPARPLWSRGKPAR